MKDWITSAFRLDPTKVVAVHSTPKALGEPTVSFQPQMTDGWASIGSLLYVGTDAPYKKLDTIVSGLDLVRRQLSRTEAWS